MLAYSGHHREEERDTPKIRRSGLAINKAQLTKSPRRMIMFFSTQQTSRSTQQAASSRQHAASDKQQQ